MAFIGRGSRAERIEDSVLTECDRIRLVVPDDPYANYPRLDTEFEVRLLTDIKGGRHSPSLGNTKGVQPGA